MARTLSHRALRRQALAALTQALAFATEKKDYAAMVAIGNKVELMAFRLQRAECAAKVAAAPPSSGIVRVVE